MSDITMRFILGLPNTAKALGKDSYKSMQSQEMETTEVLLCSTGTPKHRSCDTQTWSAQSMEKKADLSGQVPLSTLEDSQCCVHKGIPAHESYKLVGSLSEDADQIGLVESAQLDLCTRRDDDAPPFVLSLDSMAASGSGSDHCMHHLTSDAMHQTVSSPAGALHTRRVVPDSLEHRSELADFTVMPSTPRTCSTPSPEPAMHQLSYDLLANASLPSRQYPFVLSATCHENEGNSEASNFLRGATPLPIGACDGDEPFIIVNESGLQQWHANSSPEVPSPLQASGSPFQGKMTRISATSFGSLSSDGPICRICHEGAQSDEDLIAPCLCSGTMSYQHRKCLELWLQTRGTDACELCNYQFTTERKGRPFSEWIRQPERIHDRRNILTDCGCFALLTPLVCVSSWLCLNGAYHYLRLYEGRDLEGVGLVTLASILILIYLFWSLMSLRYHCTVWRTWRQEHQRVHVVTATTSPKHHVEAASHLDSSGPAPAPRSPTPCSLHAVSIHKSLSDATRV